MASAATSSAAEESDQGTATQHALAPFRCRIDVLDDEIVRLLAERFEVVREVARLKAEHGIPVRLPARIEEVCARAAETGGRQGLDQRFLRQLYGQIIDEACAFAHEMCDKAREALAPLPDVPERQSLLGLVDYVIARDR